MRKASKTVADKGISDPDSFPSAFCENSFEAVGA